MASKTLIIGKGQTGIALYKVLEKHYDTYIRGKKPVTIQGIRILHICYGWFPDFIKETEKYIEQYLPNYTIIHSTVPVGTSRKCGAYHSPVRGIHPFLEEGIEAFVKYLAPPNEELKQYFNRTGIKVMMVDEPEDTEAGKIWSTTQYGLFIALEKEIHRWCKKHGRDFNIVYTDFNKTYNEGYKKLGVKNVIRPILKQMRGKIGGHCIIPNCELLDSEITRLIKKLNKKYGI